MVGQLIFSFHKSLIVQEYADAGYLKFGMRFDNLKLSVNGNYIYELEIDKSKDVSLVELCFGAGCDTSSSKERVVSTNVPSDHFEDKKQKSMVVTPAVDVVMNIKNAPEVPVVPIVSALPPLPSVFEVGSSSSVRPMTKTQKRTMGRRLRRKYLKARMAAENTSLMRSLRPRRDTQSLQLPLSWEEANSTC